MTAESTNVVVIDEPKSAMKAKAFGKFRQPLTVFLAEMVGTAILIFCGCLCTVELGSIPSALSAAIGFGFTICLVISIISQISHSHINPCLTLCAAIYGIIPYWMILVYVPAQLIGSLIGFGLLRASMPIQVYLSKMDNGGICMALPSPGMTDANAFLCEALLTMILILVCCGLWDPRNEAHKGSIPIKFGMTVAALAIAGGHLTGTSMNPARSFGPTVYNNNWESHWIYWVAPLSSTAITTIVYRFVFREDYRNYRKDQ